MLKRALLSCSMISMVFLASGCFNSGVQPRTAKLLRGGSLGGRVSYTPYSYAPGTFYHDDGTTTEGNSGQRGMTNPLAWIGAYLISSVVGMRIGVVDWLELSAHIGMQELGGGFRVGILDEDEGDSLSLAAGSTVAWRTFTSEDRPWVSLGVDLSRRFSGVTPFANAYITYGPETHAMRLDEAQDLECDTFGSSGCSDFGAGRYLLIDRDELRLQFAVGLGLGDTTGNAILSVSMYAVLDEETQDLLCANCGYITPVDFEESWGMSLVIGGEFGETSAESDMPPLPPRIDPNAPPAPIPGPTPPPPNSTGTGDGRAQETPPPNSSGTGSP